MKKLILVSLAVIAVVAVLSGISGCGSKEGSFEREVLKGLLDDEIATSARNLFNARYDPKDGRLMHHSEIREFLREFEIDIGSLPRGLQTALEEERVLGVFVSKLSPMEMVQTNLVPVRLSEHQLRVLLWEMSFEGGHTSGEGSGGLGGLWFDEETPGVPGAGGSGASDCPNDEPWCVDNGCMSCGDYFCVCVGVFKCPPCRPCKRRCPGPPISSILETSPYFPVSAVAVESILR